MGTHRIAARWNQLIDARTACCSTVCGTTGLACVNRERNFIGIEREAEYVEIARRRIANVAPLFA